MEKRKKIHNKGKAILFKNPILEALTIANPYVIWLMYLPFIIGFPIYTNIKYNVAWSKIVIIWFIALLSWTLFEYLAHRFLFHWIERIKPLERFVYILHGNHHEYPRDRNRLFMPPVPSLLLSSIIFGVLYLTIGIYSFIFYSGFILGYLIYASMHYAIHAFAPPFKWLKPLWRNHHLHHYKNEEAGFGVSNLFWDKVFGTQFDIENEKMDKEKVQELMFDRKK